MKYYFTLKPLFLVLISTMLLIGPISVHAQTFPGGFSTVTIGSGWSEPVGTAFNKTGTKLFVWEKGGKVYVCNLSGGVYVKQATPVLDISAEVGNWRDHGMLGLALDPNYETNGLIYLLYVVDRHHLIYYGTGSYSASTNDYLSATIGRITRYRRQLVQLQRSEDADFRRAPRYNDGAGVHRHGVGP